jgi:hypothetical protein
MEPLGFTWLKHVYIGTGIPGYWIFPLQASYRVTDVLLD